MFRFIICDDDEAFCRKEKQFITEYYGRRGINTEIAVFHAGEEIIGLGKEISSYDAIFLDVSMKNGNGIDVGNWLNAAFPKMLIVFVSDHISYAPDGYKVGAVRYIMKDEKQFQSSMGECLNYILRKSREKETHYISIDGEKIRISVDKILYVDSKAHKVTYHLIENGETQSEYSVYGKLDESEALLREFGFCRIHQSYLVNMNYVLDVKRYRAVFLNGMEIQISKKNYKAAEDEFVRMRGTF